MALTMKVLFQSTRPGRDETASTGGLFWTSRSARKELPPKVGSSPSCLLPSQSAGSVFAVVLVLIAVFTICATRMSSTRQKFLVCT